MTCGVHQGIPAAGRCFNCGVWLCQECLDTAAEFGLVVCGDCMMRILLQAPE
ncbi:MAG: B-box zinc finger protein [Syntrophomonadaceae bacterium]|jgi:hypothetical protein|nr:hypothetical protein [Syntrophomonadaceae bacterium]MDH7496958.1 B-box zinc finger protein [Syntrophomonadaceae bacterium]